ncbi:MAG: hypothetical protein JRI67_10705 [Deltaproteobacteria bacterium]|nr:hypothetical protein [Deltaproteobacteria bacterium]
MVAEESIDFTERFGIVPMRMATTPPPAHPHPLPAAPRHQGQRLWVVRARYRYREYINGTGANPWDAYTTAERIRITE